MEGGTVQTDLFYIKIKLTLNQGWKENRYKNYKGKLKV